VHRKGGTGLSSPRSLDPWPTALRSARLAYILSSHKRKHPAQLPAHVAPTSHYKCFPHAPGDRPSSSGLQALHAPPLLHSMPRGDKWRTQMRTRAKKEAQRRRRPTLAPKREPAGGGRGRNREPFSQPVRKGRAACLNACRRR